MIWAILFYYLIILVTLYLWWLIFFRAYHTADNSNYRGEWKKGEKLKFPLWKLLITFPMCFVPGINIFLMIGQIACMAMLADEQDAEFRSFIFKKI